MVGVYKVDPDRQRCYELIAKFYLESQASSFCDLYGWQVLDADSGLMYDMVIAEE